MNLTWRILVIAFALMLCLYSIFPPSERLGLGKDLAGGTTIVYRIDPDENNNPPSAAQVEQIISVLRERIDPNALFDISIVAQGSSQIEITMPAPTPEVKEKRLALESILKDIGATAMSEEDLDVALKLPPIERTARLAELSAGIESRVAPLNAAAAAYDEMLRSRAEYNAVEQAEQDGIDVLQAKVEEAQKAEETARQLCLDGEIDAARLNVLLTISDPEQQKDSRDELVFATPALEMQIDALIKANAALEILQEELVTAEENFLRITTPLLEVAANAHTANEAARQAVLASSLSGREVGRILELSQEKKSARDPRTGKAVTFDSPREIQLQLLKTNYPLLIDKIDAAIAAHDEYKSVTKGFDDPKDLISLLRGAGVLTFRIAVQPTDQIAFDTLRKELREGGPNASQTSTQVGWYRLDKVEQWYDEPIELQRMQDNPYNYFLNRYRHICDVFDGEIYMLLWKTSDRSLDENTGEWELTGAARTTDQSGRPAVSFNLDARGAGFFRNLTTKNKQRQMAIVLDDRVYSAPTIQSAIGARGQLTGNFSIRDIDYLLRVLNAGSLQSKLKGPVAQSTIGPALGADNLRRGLIAGYVAIVVVGIFMICYYFMAGVVANIALLCNAIFILGFMSMYEAAFTMPGIAGIVLTFGMAVDSNVLIYERIREELETGADLKTAIRLGFEKVTSTIVDANVTNLIVCFVLGFTATAEVKGFALTLGVGIISTLICALFVTRVIFEIYANVIGAERLPMLPSVWKTLRDLLNPKVNWIGYRKVFWSLSFVAVIVSLFVTNRYWDEMLDTVFKGGTSVTISFAKNADGSPNLVPREEVESAIENWAIDTYATPGQTTLTESEYNSLKNVTVLNLNVDEVEGADFRGNQFVIKTTLEETARIEQVINTVFEGRLATRQTIHFTGSDQVEQVPSNLVRPILDADLGSNIDDSTITRNVRSYLGGVAVVLRNLSPSATSEDLAIRIDRVRQSAEYRRYGSRDVEVIGLLPTGETTEDGQALWQDIVVIVKTPNISIFQDRTAWENEVAAKEWEIIRRGLTDPASLDQVTQIGAEVAAQFRAKAIVAITLSLIGILAYIWFRFGSLRYSIAAIIALVHDVAITLGLLALTHALYTTMFGQALRIEPFKIDLGVIAALLTIIGYSLNDTIVILDRIRENRGKLAVTSADVVNRSITQTFSRTLLTSGTTLLAVTIMYWEGGTGIRPFTFAMLCGVIVGTYSSIAVAAPMVFSQRKADSYNSGS